MYIYWGGDPFHNAVQTEIEYTPKVKKAVEHAEPQV